MAKRERKNKAKKSEVSLMSVSKEVVGLKKWRDGMDKWRDNVDERLFKMATKKDFEGLAGHLADLYYQLNSNISELDSKMDMRHAEYMETLDAVMKEVKESQRERIILGRRYVDLDNEVVDHEKRLRVLEKK